MGINSSVNEEQSPTNLPTPVLCSVIVDPIVVFYFADNSPIQATTTEKNLELLSHKLRHKNIRTWNGSIIALETDNPREQEHVYNLFTGTKECTIQYSPSSSQSSIGNDRQTLITQLKNNNLLVAVNGPSDDWNFGEYDRRSGKRIMYWTKREPFDIMVEFGDLLMASQRGYYPSTYLRTKNVRERLQDEYEAYLATKDGHRLVSLHKDNTKYYLCLRDKFFSVVRTVSLPGEYVFDMIELKAQPGVMLLVISIDRNIKLYTVNTYSELLKEFSVDSKLVFRWVVSLENGTICIGEYSKILFINDHKITHTIDVVAPTKAMALSPSILGFLQAKQTQVITTYDVVARKMNNYQLDHRRMQGFVI
jgi:hypothetical protein